MEKDRSGHELVTDVRIYTPEDYQMACEWWTKHNWPIVPEDDLSKTGVVTSVNGVPACIGWIYTTNSSIAWLGFVVSNPDVEREYRSAGIDLMIEMVKKLSVSWGFKHVWMSVHPKQARYKKRFVDAGFREINKGVDAFLWSI